MKPVTLMRVVRELPPNIEKIKEKFTVQPNAVFTYDNTVYAPTHGYLDTYLITHEETHVKQQGDDAEKWWDRYLEDKDFRLSQEVEAYHNQYEHFCRNKKDVYRWSQFLKLLARDLSGPMYGSMCTQEEAENLIKNSQ